MQNLCGVVMDVENNILTWLKAKIHYNTESWMLKKYYSACGLELYKKNIFVLLFENTQQGFENGKFLWGSLMDAENILTLFKAKIHYNMESFDLS